MFSRLLRVSVPLSSSPPSSPSAISSSKFSPGRQLRAELREAVDRSMVSTRSQDHTPAGDVGPKDFDSNRGSGAKNGKRRVQIDENAVTPSQPPSKRRRAISKLKSDVAPTTKSTGPEESLQKEDDEVDTMVTQHLAVSEQDDPLQKATETTNSASASLPEPSPHAPSTEDVTKNASLDPQQGNGPSEPTSVESVEAESHFGTAPGAMGRKESKKRPSGPESNATGGVNDLEHAHSGKARAALSPAVPAKATYKRFDSQEPELPEPQPQEAHNEPAPSDDNIDNDSDDEQPPETLTASAAQNQARTAALESARAAAAQDEKRKLKRRERDARLKMQAMKAEKNHTTKMKGPKLQPTAIDDIAEEEEDENTAASGKRSSKARRSLPALLPDHILADEPDEIRPLALAAASSSTKALINTKRKFLDTDSKPPKDLKRGNVKVRVLPEESTFLAPKASQRGKTLREAWLMGRGLQRRKMGGGSGGFVRR